MQQKAIFAAISTIYKSIPFYTNNGQKATNNPNKRRDFKIKKEAFLPKRKASLI